MRTGDEGEGGQQDLAGQPRGLGQNLEGQRSVACGHAMLHAETRLNQLFEFLNERPAVREARRVENALEPLVKPLPVAVLGRPVWSGSAKAGGPPRIARSSIRDFIQLPRVP